MDTPPWSPDRYLTAYRFAAEAHRGQTVPGTDGLPYLMHLSLVCMEVMSALAVEPGDDPDLAIQCALLHDVIEDTDVTHEQVLASFGRAVADGVQALSKDPGLPKAERMADSLARIQAQPRAVWLVKLADRITNLAPPPASWSADKRARYRDEAGRILAALGGASAYLSARMQARIEAYAAHLAQL
ncbi:HD domain-containing protein [Haliangium sp.]|uniref:HD domain-containing protein n=1 Tax=Haliangium sp. TaxID=2663208 RepID=UPI003D10C245